MISFVNVLSEDNILRMERTDGASVASVQNVLASFAREHHVRFMPSSYRGPAPDRSTRYLLGIMFLGFNADLRQTWAVQIERLDYFYPAQMMILKVGVVGDDPDSERELSTTRTLELVEALFKALGQPTYSDSPKEFPSRDARRD